MNQKTPVFFLVKNRALGDSLMGLASVSYLRSLFPQSTIIYAVPAWVAPLYEASKTDADIIYPLKLKNLGDILELYTDLINLKVEVIHEMHLSGRGQKVFSIFSLLKNIPFTSHNHHETKKTLVIDQGVKKELIQRDLDGLYSFYGLHQKCPNFLDFTPKLDPVEKLKKYPMVILGVVATRQTKIWPLENYVELARLIYQKFPKTEVVIPLSKSSEDEEIKQQLCSLDLPNNVSIKNWDLNYLPIAFSQAILYIGNDTGLKHLAIAVGIKTYTFFGPEPALEWHPYNSQAHPYFYLENLACRTRTHHYCGLRVCDLPSKNMECLKIFKASTVFEKIERDLLL